MRLSFVLDCADPVKLAEFWTAALGYEHVVTAEPYVILHGEGPRFILQRVAEPKPGKNRMHMDLHVDDIHAEADRLVGLGAIRGVEIAEFDTRWICMSDPEGNEFCVCAS